MRTKKEALSLIEQHGFNASLVVDVGVATGTDGLYEVWPDAHYVLVEALPKFKEDLESIADADVRASCEKKALAFGKVLLKERSQFDSIQQVVKALEPKG